MTNNLQQPFFSIIIPAYNVEKYIKNTINSVVNQKFQDYELIIIEDCSTDSTLSIIENYVKSNEKIKIIKQPENSTQHVARIDGVAAAQGLYILFLDGDDSFTENAFAILNEYIITNPNFDFYEFGYIRMPSSVVVLPLSVDENRFHSFFYKKKYPLHTVWNRVYETNILKKAFSSMKRIRINQGVEDYYESVVISYYSKKYTIIKKVIINYSIGIGISTTYKCYDAIIAYLDSTIFMIGLVEEFLKINDFQINLDNVMYRYMSFAIKNYFITQKDNNEKNKLFQILPNYFSIPLILKYLESSCSKYFFKNKELKSSKDYRLGRFLLFPIRKIKYFISQTRALIKKN